MSASRVGQFAGPVLGGALALSGGLWWLASRPAMRLVDRPPMTMHVEEVVPTDASFREPARAFSNGLAYWRVLIRDAREQPVADARVHVDLVDSGGGGRARLMMITNAEGLARFTYPLGSLPSGVYTVRVVDVSHLERPDARYDRAANSGSANSFSVP
jgi:hypothetical protein